MRFYRATRFLFPNDLKLRLFTICFVGTHLPLISFAGWEWWSGRFGWTETVLLLVATLAGTALALGGIHALLAPVSESARAIDAMAEGRRVELSGHDSRDLMGMLIASVNRAATSTQMEIARLDDAAHRDVLTGLWNRRGFHANLGEAVRGRVVSSLALIDLDNFKAINDRHGHRTGDDVLRMLAHRLVGGLRRGDLIARWGGEEFLVLLPGASVQDATQILARLAAESRCDPIPALGGVCVTFSGGVAQLKPDDVDAAIAQADAALYRAKRAGRDRIIASEAVAR